jgi:hypothetical protein
MTQEVKCKANIKVTEKRPRCRRSSHFQVEWTDDNLSISSIIESLKDGLEVSLYVEDWEKPWPMLIDINGKLRARCPTNLHIVPFVEYTFAQGKDVGAYYAGDEPNDRLGKSLERFGDLAEYFKHNAGKDLVVSAARVFDDCAIMLRSEIQRQRLDYFDESPLVMDNENDLK